MSVLERIQILPKSIKKDATFNVIILNTPLLKNSYNGRLLGMTLAEWVAFACQGLNISVVDYNASDNILQLCREYIDCKYDYTIILLSRTPLIQSSTIQDIKEFCIYKDISICKLPVGYVVNNNKIADLDGTMLDSIYSQNIDDFYIVETKKQMDYACNILQDRINNFHIANGVDIIKPATTYIEPQVDIGCGAIIYSGNTLKGNTIIGENVILKENNVIDNSVIGKDSCISSSIITNSRLSPSVYVSAFCEINNTIIETNTTIGGSSQLFHQQISGNQKIAPNTTLGENNDSNSGAR